jgi:methylmalonyl-CoA mutase
VDQVIIKDVDSLETIWDVLGKRFKGKPTVKAYLSGLPTKHLLKHFYLDPISNQLKTGKPAVQGKQTLANLFQARLNQLEPDRFLLVDATVYKMAGANVVQEMALALQHGLEYFDLLTEAGFTAEAVARNLEFKLAFGNSFFTEIAKGRAFRYLVYKLYQAYEVDEEVSIWGEGSLHYFAHQDMYNNLLRGTTMSMSAILGNCNKVSTPAYDELDLPSSLGIRMAKNTQLILKEEAYFAKVKDTVAGSYYLESLSLQLAEAAWEKFMDFEKEGTLMERFESGSLQNALQSALESRKRAYQKGKIMLGVNRYQNPEGKAVNYQTPSKNGLKQSILATEIETE